MGWSVIRRGAVMCAVALAPLACAHGGATPTAESPAQAPVNRDAKALAVFQKRVDEYLTLHNRLEATLPRLPQEASPQEIDRHQRALEQLIRDARRTAKPGDIITPASRRVMLRLVRQVFGGPDGPELRASIMDENPGTLRISVNSRYPDAVPLSTVPPQLLAGLPPLPDDLEYRFIGRRLILMDVHAHLIVDFIDRALPA